MIAAKKPARDLDAAVKAFRLDLHEEYKGEEILGGRRVAIFGLRVTVVELDAIREFLGADYRIDETKPKEAVPGTAIVWCTVDVRRK